MHSIEGFVQIRIAPIYAAMLLGLLAGVINRHIKPYFEGIDASQLTGSIFGGGVTLTDLQIRPTLFEHLGIPFHVVAGRCGKLEVQYSLTKLYSEPVVVILKDLHILIKPSKGVPYNEEAEAESSQRDKMEQLEVFESVKKHVKAARKRKSLVRKSKKSGSSTPQYKEQARQPETVDPSYFDSWVMKIVRNLRIVIESVHVRYEDEITKPKAPFGVGVFLNSLHVNTTDSRWKSKYIEDYVPETNYKVVRIKGLSIYWNSSPTTLYKDKDKEEILENLAQLPDSSSRLYRMLITPLAVDLKVSITPFPNALKYAFSKPKLFIQTDIAKLSVTVLDKQCKDIIMFLDTIDGLAKGLMYRKFRVQLNGVPYKGNYKRWWKFAYTCVLDDIQKSRRTYLWPNIQEHRKKCRRYIRAYYKKTAGDTSTAITNTLADLEKELDLFNIILLRQHAEILHNRLTRPGSDGPDAGNWFSSWFQYSYWFPENERSSIHEFGLYSATSIGTLENPEFSARVLSPYDKDIIRVAIRFAENIDVFSYPEEYIAIKVQFHLKILRLRLFRNVGRNYEAVMDGILETVNFELNLRPANQGLVTEIKIGRIDIYPQAIPGTDHRRRSSDVPLPLITTANPEAVEYFIKFTYEKNPLTADVDHKVTLEGLALQFTYLKDAIDRIVECFILPDTMALILAEQLGQTPARRVLRKVAKFRDAQIPNLLKVMKDKGKLELSICLIAPYLVMPIDSTKRGKSNFVVINLGEINVVGTVVGGTLCENGKCSSII